VLRTLSGDIEDYFGANMVTEALEKSAKTLIAHIAIQTVPSSAAHLTKYANITDISTGQKKLIVDDAIVPTFPVFDYQVTYNIPPVLAVDGGLDGIAHCLEVLYSGVGKPDYDRIAEIAHAGMSLVVEHLPCVMQNPHDEMSSDALCLATDMGGYAIMVGGTNGGHLTSFSLVDILSHGRACGILNPYYTVLFAPAIEKPLRLVGNIYKSAGFTNVDIDGLIGRELGLAIAEAMFKFARQIDFPVCLEEVPGFTAAHIERALTAAKNPQLKMKLQNMPIPLTAEMVDDYMGPVLQAARTGDLDLVKNPGQALSIGHNTGYNYRITTYDAGRSATES